MTTTSNERLLDWPKLGQKIPYTRQHIGRLERAGEFPRRVQVGPGRVAWLESDRRHEARGATVDRKVGRWRGHQRQSHNSQRSAATDAYRVQVDANSRRPAA